tara:strand:+ start:1948 stop:2337 length:390 start_codon:yes stop_codon:yes gene_type:complete
MKERDEVLKEIRLQIDLPAQGTLAIEKFQNNTLRPILKFQNLLIIEIFRDYLKKNHRTFTALNQKVQLEIIRESLKKDQRIKNQFIAIITAFFTVDEFTEYTTGLNELNKRIVSMTTQRLQDQLSRLIL